MLHNSYENFCQVSEKNLLGLFFAWLIDSDVRHEKRWVLHMIIHGNKSKIQENLSLAKRSDNNKKKKTILWQFEPSHSLSRDCAMEAPVASERKTSLHGWFSSNPWSSQLWTQLRTHKWPAPNVSFIAQLIRASHRYREVTSSNPVEVLPF